MGRQQKGETPILSVIATFVVMAALPTIVAGSVCGLVMPGIATQQGLRRGIVVGQATFALCVGLFLIQGGWVIYLAIACDMAATGRSANQASRNGLLDSS